MREDSYHTGQFSTAIVPSASTKTCLGDYSPSSRITLSPKTMTSNSPFPCRRVSMFLLGRLRALTSRAQTPILPMTGVFAVEHQSAQNIFRAKLFIQSGSLLALVTVEQLGRLCLLELDLVCRAGLNGRATSTAAILSRALWSV